jgi:alpha-L-arabinofuranosidase
VFAGSIYEKNDEAQPQHIQPQESSLAISSGDLEYTFRHESVTVIELE